MWLYPKNLVRHICLTHTLYYRQKKNCYTKFNEKLNSNLTTYLEIISDKPKKYTRFWVYGSKPDSCGPKPDSVIQLIEAVEIENSIIPHRSFHTEFYRQNGIKN